MESMKASVVGVNELKYSSHPSLGEIEIPAVV